MQNFVITLRENDKSVKAAERCIQSGEQYGMEIDHYEAYTPSECHDFIKENKINDRLFNNSPYSREDNARAAFCSHFSLWQACVELKEQITIFEHDAVIVAPIPDVVFDGCISFGAPSYGSFNTPPMIGPNLLTSKPYFPGAHAYRINPMGARKLIEQARLEARPTDIFLNKTVFPFLQEYYPWPVIVRETFSTIQKEKGCLAKHMYNEDYVIEEV